MPRPLHELRDMLEHYIPFNNFLGIRLVALEAGQARLELPFRPELIGDPGRPALHGGVIATLLDTAGGFAVWTQMERDDRLSTVDLRVDYLAHGRPESLLVDAAVVRLGNRIAVTDMRCFQPGAPERVVATGKAVYNVRRKDEL